MSPERGISPEAQKETLAKGFRDVIERAVAPIMKGRGNGHRTIYHHSEVAAITSVTLDDNRIEYVFFKPEAAGTKGGLQGLNFIPSHGIELFTAKTQTMFGLKKDNTIVRSHRVKSELLGPMVNRELDLEESHALLDYIAAPHLNTEKRHIALRLTPNEKEILEKRLSEDQVAAVELRRDLEELERNRRAAWQHAKDVWLS